MAYEYIPFTACNNISIPVNTVIADKRRTPKTCWRPDTFVLHTTQDDMVSAHEVVTERIDKLQV